MSIAINAPSSNIGSKLARKLLDAGEKVVVISRDAAKVSALAERGARVVRGSFDDASVLDQAFAGADAVFWLTPPPARPDWLEWGIAAGARAASAARKHGVKRAVVLSSIGAQGGRGTGPVGILRDIENAFEAAVPDVASLRAGFFMENFLHQVQPIATAGSIFLPFPPDAALPMVATADIALVAAAWHLAPWRGHHRIGVHGPRDVSFAQAAEIIGKAIGRAVRYTKISLDQMRQSMVGSGMPAFVVDALIELYGKALEGGLAPAEPRTPATTTATTLLEFARDVLKPAIDGVKH